MMPLYPTFEDLKVDEIINHQNQKLMGLPPVTYSPVTGCIGLDQTNFRYDEFGQLVPGPVSSPVVRNVPSQPIPNEVAQIQPALFASTDSNAIQKSSGDSAEIRHGIRRIVLCKDSNGKVGVQLISVNNGIFISFVRNQSPAALGGLRFGDQVLAICDHVLAGLSSSKAMRLIGKAAQNNVVFLVRDRPLERTVVVNKNSSGSLGITVEHGMITAIVKDSSAARNGVLTNHHIVEVDGQNVLGLKDKQLVALLRQRGASVRLTLLPHGVYRHLVRHLWNSQLRYEMDRSIPEA
ncbi:putative pdz domain containing protein [Paragonimus heterotremus]|uniref:Putative pdz domain containing protein n=1 Tax=Paragonimus heterotremus TaxID=100268 RepID=A0A8J4WEC4_9TREM|nr:putative pdz domain containing protein [Paragonimus heterotremus]